MNSPNSKRSYKNTFDSIRDIIWKKYDDGTPVIQNELMIAINNAACTIDESKCANFFKHMKSFLIIGISREEF